MDSGKPQKQALAIAYSIKRKAKMAKGGMAMEPAEDSQSKFLTADMDTPFSSDPEPFEQIQPEDSNEHGHDEPEYEDSMLSKILKRVRMRNMGKE